MQQGPNEVIVSEKASEASEVKMVEAVKTEPTPSQELETLIQKLKELGIDSKQAPAKPGFFSYFSTPKEPSTEVLEKTNKELQRWQDILQLGDKAQPTTETSVQEIKERLEPEMQNLSVKRDELRDKYEEKWQAIEKQSPEAVKEDCGLLNVDQRAGIVTAFRQSEQNPKVGKPQNEFALKLLKGYEDVRKVSPEVIKAEKEHLEKLKRVRIGK